MHLRYIIMLLAIESVFASGGCASPSDVPPPSEALLASAAALEMPTTDDRIKWKIHGVRLPSRGLIIDAVVVGPKSMTSHCAARIADIISLSSNPNQYISLRAGDTDVSLRPWKRAFHWPWVHVQWGAPPQYVISEDQSQVKVLQTILLDAASLPSPGNWNAKFDADAARRLDVPAHASALQCIRMSDFHNDWQRVSASQADADGSK